MYSYRENSIILPENPFHVLTWIASVILSTLFLIYGPTYINTILTCPPDSFEVGNMCLTSTGIPFYKNYTIESNLGIGIPLTVIGSIIMAFNIGFLFLFFCYINI